MNRQSTEWENIFTIYPSHKGLISRVYQRILNKFTRKKNSIKKWAKDMNRHFSKENIHPANKHMKKSSTSLTIREVQIKTTVRFHLTPVRVVLLKSPKTTDANKGAEKRNTFTLWLGV